MRRLLFLIPFLSLLLQTALHSSQTSIRPPELLLKSYARPSVFNFEVGASFPLLHSTDGGYYVQVNDGHDVVLFLNNEDLALPARVRGEDTIEFWEAYTLQTDRAYLAFMPEVWYRVLSETEEQYKIEYRLGETKMHLSVGRDEFEVAKHIVDADGALVDRMVKDPQDAICVINFQGGVSGSGFLLYDADVLYCYTNQHVAMNVGRMSVTMIDGLALELGDLEIAADSDLARFVVRNELPGFETAGTARLQDAVKVLGNSLGAGRITVLKGEVTGLNAMQVETSAKFVGGNSGSPILNEANEVVGVATFLEHFPNHESIVKGSTFEDGRRVGMRLDRALEWVPVDRSQYTSRNRLILQTMNFIKELPVAIGAAIADSFTEQMVLQHVSDPVIQRWLRGRISQLRSIEESFEETVQANVRLRGTRFYNTASYSKMQFAFSEELLAESATYWHSLKQKVIAKRRAFIRATPYPNTPYMRKRISNYADMLSKAESVIEVLEKAK